MQNNELSRPQKNTSRQPVHRKPLNEIHAHTKHTYNHSTNRHEIDPPHNIHRTRRRSKGIFDYTSQVIHTILIILRFIIKHLKIILLYVWKYISIVFSFLQKKSRGHEKSILKIFFIGFLLIIGSLFIWIATLKIPSIDAFHNRKVITSTQILDRTGKISLYDVHGEVQRQIVETTEIPDITKSAVIAIEDKEFYNHHGIVPRSIARGFISQFLPLMKDSGGSTITQQVLKNTILSNERSVTRKVKEWVLALKIEKQMTKDEILALYLNEAPYGGTLYGISEASRVFFNKKSSQLTLSESAYIAAIPNAPTYFSPYSEAGRERLEERKNLVLKKMFEQNMISRDEYNTARDEYVAFTPPKESSAKAMHFVEYVRAYLEKKYGKDALTTEGLRVYTTLNWDLQQTAEETIRENAFKNEAAWRASNSALVGIDPKTGEILSMVGSRDYFDTKIDGQFNVATALRQPGSSFKPIVYTRAFEKGYEPETTLFDVPTSFAGSCGPNASGEGCYAPQNYDNKFVGPVNLRNALGQSRNIPAVKLLYLVGIDDALRTARNLGITSLNKSANHYGLSLVLGGGEVSLLEMTSVYATLGNDGVYNKPHAIIKIVDADGKILEEYKPDPQQVISAEAVRRTNSVLSDNIARTPLFGANSLLNIPGVATKTGTTNDNKDAWMIGYTPTIAVGVWSGNNDNKPMTKGSIISGPAWNTYIRAALNTIGTGSFIEPSKAADYYSAPPVIRGLWQGGESFTIDTTTGNLATENTPTEVLEERVTLNVKSILYWVDKENPRVFSQNHSDGQLARWQAGIDNWVANNSSRITGTGIKPTQYSNAHNPENAPVATIETTDGGSIYSITSPISINVSITQKVNPLRKFTLTYNGRLLDEFSPSDVGIITINPSQYGITPGTGTISVNAFDAIMNKGTASKEITFTP
jgi:1A family penicillin-binding protein